MLEKQTQNPGYSEEANNRMQAMDLKSHEYIREKIQEATVLHIKEADSVNHRYRKPQILDTAVHEYIIHHVKKTMDMEGLGYVKDTGTDNHGYET